MKARPIVSQASPFRLKKTIMQLSSRVMLIHWGAYYIQLTSGTKCPPSLPKDHFVTVICNRLHGIIYTPVTDTSSPSPLVSAPSQHLPLYKTACLRSSTRRQCHQCTVSVINAPSVSSTRRQLRRQRIRSSFRYEMHRADRRKAE